MKRKLEDLSAADRKQTRTLLFTAAFDAHQKGRHREFLEGLLTPSEQIMLGRRIWIARMLLAGSTYQEIGKKLKVGTTTIIKIERWLQGQLPDYEQVLQQYEKEALVKKRRQVARENPFSLTALKLKYPLHFLLFPWPKE
jgi:uncharacterized protein YerC